jgi:hypothetical protein
VRGDLDPLEHLAEDAVVGVRVHAHGPADGSRDVDRELDPAEAEPRGARGDRGQARAAAADKPVAVALGPRQLALELDDQPAHAGVRDE